VFKVVDGFTAKLWLQKNENVAASFKQSLFLNNQIYNHTTNNDVVGDANKMLIVKIVAILIPVITAAVWTYFFLTVPTISLTKFFLVALVVPLMLVAIYIMFKVWSKG